MTAPPPPAWKSVEAHLAADGALALRLQDGSALADASPVEMLLAAVAGASREAAMPC